MEQRLHIRMAMQAGEILREVARMVQENERLTRRAQELLEANNETEEKRRDAERKLRLARATIELLQKALYDRNQRISSQQDQIEKQCRLFGDLKENVIHPLSECAKRHSDWFGPEEKTAARVALIVDACADLYRDLQNPMQSVKEALAAFDRRIGIKNKPPDNGVANCPCWATGRFAWVDGCPGHPRESMT